MMRDVEISIAEAAAALGVQPGVASESDGRTVNNGEDGNAFRHNYRVLSDAEKDLMRRIKDEGPAFLNLLDEVKRANGKSGRACALAATKMEEAVMWAVKGLTE